MFVFSVAAWFPGGATRSQPSIPHPSPLHLAPSPAYASSPADRRDYQNTCKAGFQARG